MATVTEMATFEVCWAYEQEFSTKISGDSEEEVRRKFGDGDFDAAEVDEGYGRMVDDFVEVFEVNE